MRRGSSGTGSASKKRAQPPQRIVVSTRIGGTSHRRRQYGHRVNGIGAWNCMLGFVEAFYLCGLHEEAAALSPLVERALELGRRWLALDGRLLETRAGIAAAAAGRWDEAEHQFAIAREVAEQMSNRLELADLSRLHARMLLDRGSTGDHARAAVMLDGCMTCLNCGYSKCG